MDRKNYLYSNTIITNIEHFVHGRLFVDDFWHIVIGFEIAAEVVGSTYVDHVSMGRFVDWHRFVEGGPYELLVSLDGKFSVIAPRAEIANLKLGSDWVDLEGLAAPIERVKSQTKRLIKANPDVSRKLNLRGLQTAIPERIVFRPGGDFVPGSVSAEVRDAIRHIEGASDDALVWIKMLGINPNLKIDENLLNSATIELNMRIQKGSEFRSTFFPLTDVTLKEIALRGRRAKRDLQKFREKFPHERELGFDYNLAMDRAPLIESYCRGLSNDRLVELCVFLFNTEDWHGESFKLVGMEFYRRAGYAGD